MPWPWWKYPKQRLQIMRDNGWNALLDEVASFCAKHEIIIFDMNDKFVAWGRPRRRAEEITNLHQYYRVELFYTVIDMQLQELNNHFTEVNAELLLCLACLNRSNLFSTFDKQKLVPLAQFYLVELSTLDLMALDNQLETYIINMRSNSEFSKVNGMSNLAQKMVEMKNTFFIH